MIDTDGLAQHAGVTVEFAVIRIPRAIRAADWMRVRRTRARALTRGRGAGRHARATVTARNAGTNVFGGGSEGGVEDH